MNRKNNKAYVKLISNTGILIYNGNEKILIDAIYSDNAPMFSKIPSKVWGDMLSGDGEFSNADYVMFTHSHLDHFCENRLNDYLNKNEVKGVLAPYDYEMTNLNDKLLTDYTINNLDSEFKIKTFEVRHIDKNYHHIKNRCFHIISNNIKIIVLGDAEASIEDFLKYNSIECDIAFVTPVFYSSPNGRKILSEILKAKYTLIYHIPDTENDKFNYRRLAKANIERHSNDIEQAYMFSDFGQTIYLN